MDLKPISLHPEVSASRKVVHTPRLGIARNVGIYVLISVVFTYIDSISAIEDFRQKGGKTLWEPIVWSGTSIFVIVALSYAIYRFTEAFPITRKHWFVRSLIHLGGSVVFSVVHILAMFALREIIYALVGSRYEMGGIWKIFAYEYSKDIISYFLVVLISHFVLLWRHMNQARIKALSLEADLAQLQLRRLQEQLRPHFLFNTLNHISSCMYEDVEKADKLLSDLCSLLRYSLKEDHLITVPMKEELVFLKLYLNLMNQRFSGRIDTHFQIDDSLLTAQVPRFMLQPLVENAIQHGFEHRDGSGRIDIRVYGRAERLFIEVADDGIGLHWQEEDKVVHGYGLGNILAILEQRHPQDSQLTMEPNPGGGVCVRIEMPLNLEPELAEAGIQKG